MEAQAQGGMKAILLTDVLNPHLRSDMMYGFMRALLQPRAHGRNKNEVMKEVLDNDLRFG
jgi:hypothetical protein